MSIKGKRENSKPGSDGKITNNQHRLRKQTPALDE